MRFKSCIVLLILAGFMSCGPRAAGPQPSEFGSTFFWRVLEKGAINFNDQCSDLPEIRDVEEASLAENAYLIYRIADEGGQAQSQDCDRIDTSTCTPGDIEFSLEQSTLTGTLQLDSDDLGGGCALIRDLTIVLEDEGETLNANFDIAFRFEGPSDSCDLFENDIRSRSNNDRGLVGCVVTTTYDAIFTRALSD